MVWMSTPFLQAPENGLPGPACAKSLFVFEQIDYAGWQNEQAAVN
jgi:hypothetical protein